MKSTRILSVIIVLMIVMAAASLMGCNMPGTRSEPGDMDVTQAFQTVQAQLTQAVVQPLLQTASQTPISLPEETAAQTLVISPTGEPSLPQGTLPPGTRCNQAAAAYPKIDITIPDGTEVKPAEEFTKIWRVVNVGTCTWTPEYDLAFFSGELMGAPVSLDLNTTVTPNQSIDLMVDMVAPSDPGTYQSNWKIRDPDGVLFGIGPNGESPFWARIQVVLEAAEHTPTPEQTPTPTAAVQVNGPVTLVISDTINLDNLQLNSAGEDLEFKVSSNESSHYQLAPVGTVTVFIYGSTEPDLNECREADQTQDAVNLDEISPGTYFCYRTDLGLPGWARVEVFDSNAASVDLQVLTWKLP